MAELGVRLIFARSPQAKGRVERAAGTLQDRLVTELRLASATTIGEAQTVLERFLPRFNARFAVAARQPEPAWRPLDPALDLGAVLAFRHTRTVARDNTVKYHWRTLQLLPSPQRPSYAGARVEVLERPGGELAVRHQGETIPSRLAPPRSGVLRERRSELARDPALERIASGPRLRCGPARQAGASCRGERDQPSTAPRRRPGSSRCARPPRASRRSGRPSARHTAGGSRCAPPPACSASPATRSAPTSAPAAHPDARVRHHLPAVRVV